MSQEQTKTIIKPDVSEEIDEPQLYRVLLLNDDYTTMDFVIHVLEAVFHRTPAEATRIMLHVHKKGAGVCGVYPLDIAEMKVAAVHELALKHEFPLKCVMEKE